MNIGSICTRRMIAVDSTSTLVQAASLMREHHVGEGKVRGRPLDCGNCRSAMPSGRAGGAN